MLQQMRSSAKYIFVFLFFAFVVGFLLMDTSGLLGGPQLTPTTPVATVNGREILYQDWFNRAQQQIQAEQQRSGRALSLDETRQVEDAVLDQLVLDVLLQEEYERRGIGVSDDEIREYARFVPPDWVRNDPSMHTEGQFDPAKYQRLLASPLAKQQGLLAGLEQYYRTEIPKQKLQEQVMSGLYVTDAELWRSYQDRHDSAQVSFVAFRPAPDLKPDASISDGDLREYYRKNESRFERQPRAVLSVISIPRVVTAADSAAVRARAAAIRAEIVGGANFEEVARRESADSASAIQGGDLGSNPRGSFVPAFDSAVFSLPIGQVSQPIATQYGYHIIRVESRRGDTASTRHILLPFRQSDSSAVLVDRKADELAGLAAGATEPAKFDSAAKQLGLEVIRVDAVEGEPAIAGGRIIPGVSAWAFGGAVPGETSDLFDAEDGYFLARLDSLTPGGSSFDAVKDEIRMRLTWERAVEALVPQAQQLATAAKSGSLEAAAQSRNLQVEKTQRFTRASPVPGLGQLTQAVGAAFGLPVGQVSGPVKTEDGVFVLRVDERTQASRQAFEAQKATQREQQLAQLRNTRMQQFLIDLRSAAKIVDRRKEINAMVRRAEG